MSWAVGFDDNWKRDIGYGVPATCDYPGCGTEINRGLSYVCGGEPYGGNEGCGLYFCGKHLVYTIHGKQVCDQCGNRRKPFKPTPDLLEWTNHKMTDPSWEEWRKRNELAKDEVICPSCGNGSLAPYDEDWECGECYAGWNDTKGERRIKE